MSDTDATMPAAPPASAVDVPAGLTPIGRLVGAALLDSVLSMVTLGIGWAIWAFITSAEGQTPGKKLMNIAVVDADTGQRLDRTAYILKRGLVGGIVNSFAVSLTLGVLFFMPLWDKRNQTVAARISNSVAVDV